MRGAAANLDFAPPGLAAQEDEKALIENIDPATTVLGLIAAKVEAGDFGAA
ncbi:hypothetical protein HFO33_29350 [Rhizobium leguminosarum]|nr:hypothetical protein [Rhizobium leguminosarum]MBY5680398.1 hypothetical protein [Rhizobium leguminosarum]MBY5720645.1 hypothetical protein [Rhizobium leguminosarum]